MMNLNDLVPFNEYRNKKNQKLYMYISIVKHSETLEDLVLYQPIDDGGTWVRPLHLFLEKFEVPTYED